MNSRKGSTWQWVAFFFLLWCLGVRWWYQVATTIAYSFLMVQKECVALLQPLFDRTTEKALKSELILYKQMLNKAEDELIQIKAESAYYNDIKELIDFKKRYSQDNAVLAQVLLKNFSLSAHYFLLDAGKNKQIEPDMVVVSGNKLVGKIVEVFPYYSKVLLVTDPLCKVAVKTAKTGVKGIHEGCLSLDKTTIKYMSHLETIEQNDLVLTSGEGLVFPQGFAVGILQEFFIKNLQYQVTVKPVVNFQTLAYCTIVQKGSELVAQPSLDN